MYMLEQITNIICLDVVLCWGHHIGEPCGGILCNIFVVIIISLCLNSLSEGQCVIHVLHSLKFDCQGFHYKLQNLLVVSIEGNDDQNTMNKIL